MKQPEVLFLSPACTGGLFPYLNCIFQRARTLALHKIQDFCMTNLDAEQLIIELMSK